MGYHSGIHIVELEKTGKVLRTLPLHAPISGYVLKMNLREGMYVTPDLELYTLADLSRIWVLADFYEYEIPEVKLGQVAYYRSRVFSWQEVSRKSDLHLSCT